MIPDAIGHRFSARLVAWSGGGRASRAGAGAARGVNLRHPRRPGGAARSVILGALALLVVACSSEPSDSSGEAARTSVPSTAGAEPRGTSFRSTSFMLPFEAKVPTWLPAKPSVEEARFVTWESTSTDQKVRFLLPVVVYQPGQEQATAVPVDYLAYLRGQAASGATLSDERSLQVGGHTATLLTATTTRGLDGSLGCQRKGMLASDCFGLQPDLVLRLAVVPLPSGTLVAWARSAVDKAGNANQLRDFDAMMAGLVLRPANEAPPSTASPSSPAVSPSIRALAGTWGTGRVVAARWVASARRAGASASEAAAFFAQFGDGTNTGDGHSGIRVEGSRWEVLEAYGDDQLTPGGGGALQSPSPGRLILSGDNPTDCTVEFAYKLTGDTLTMHEIRVTPATKVCLHNDYPAMTSLLATAPMKRTP